MFELGKELSVISELPLNVANQIAAGEVVERPANVLKELIENSLDAGAQHIDILIEDAGRKLISVRDDGLGMSRIDVEKCIRAHATSKIKHVDDLMSIASYGFRGEALPAIASVSRFRLVSSRDSEEGTEIMVDCGGEATAHVAALPRGTLVEVRDLFCNQPVRLKFLKSPAAEVGLLRKIVNTYALGNPGTAFRLTVDGRKLLQFCQLDTFEERLRVLVGDEIFSQLVPVEIQDGDLCLKGFVQPTCSFDRIRHEQYFFVNERPATAPIIHVALHDALGGGRIEGRPFICLKLGIPTHDVDVNIHPTKREVRFKTPQKVHNVISGGIARCLKKKVSSQMPTQNRLDSMPITSQEAALCPLIPSSKMDNLEIHLPEPQFHLELPVQEKEAVGNNRNHVHVIGQTSNGLILAENLHGLLMIDPSAAWERISYEKLLRGEFSVQPLLIPLIVEIPQLESPSLVSAQDELNKLGFEIDELAPGSWKVNAVPSLACNCDLRELLLGMATGLTMDAKMVRSERLARSVAKSVGHTMTLCSLEILQKLVEELVQTAQPYLRPSDKSATTIFFSYNDIDRKLGK